jgi:hypothetical protein
MTPQHYLASYKLDQRSWRVHRLSHCPATLLSGMHGIKRQYAFPPLLRVSVVTFPYQLHNLNTWIRNYKHAYIRVYSSPYCQRHVRVSCCPLTTRWLITCANLFIHPPTLTHKHTHRLRSLIHRYRHSRSRTDVVSTNSALLIRKERLRTVGQDRK